MKTIEYTTIDKSTWKRGKWDNEPDKIQWQDEETKLPCLIVRQHSSGHLCGYVGVSEGHPAFKQEYEKVNANAHGGLTFSDMCQPSEKEECGICHKPDEGEPDHVWWLGFDCAHLGDFSPGYDHTFSGDSYKSVEYVRTECKNLAQQLAALR